MPDLQRDRPSRVAPERIRERDDLEALLYSARPVEPFQVSRRRDGRGAERPEGVLGELDAPELRPVAVLEDALLFRDDEMEPLLLRSERRHVEAFDAFRRALLLVRSAIHEHCYARCFVS